MDIEHAKTSWAKKMLPVVAAIKKDVNVRRAVADCALGKTHTGISQERRITQLLHTYKDFRSTIYYVKSEDPNDICKIGNNSIKRREIRRLILHLTKDYWSNFEPTEKQNRDALDGAYYHRTKYYQSIEMMPFCYSDKPLPDTYSSIRLLGDYIVSKFSEVQPLFSNRVNHGSIESKCYYDCLITPLNNWSKILITGVQEMADTTFEQLLSSLNRIQEIEKGAQKARSEARGLASQLREEIEKVHQVQSRLEGILKESNKNTEKVLNAMKSGPSVTSDDILALVKRYRDG